MTYYKYNLKYKIIQCGSISHMLEQDMRLHTFVNITFLSVCLNNIFGVTNFVSICALHNETCDPGNKKVSMLAGLKC